MKSKSRKNKENRGDKKTAQERQQKNMKRKRRKRVKKKGKRGNTKRKQEEWRARSRLHLSSVAIRIYALNFLMLVYLVTAFFWIIIPASVSHRLGTARTAAMSVIAVF